MPTPASPDSACTSQISIRLGIVFGNGTTVGVGAQSYPLVTQATLGANVATVGNTPFNSTAAGITNIVYGQDLVTTVKTIGEGAGTPGVLASDPLRNATWATPPF